MQDRVRTRTQEAAEFFFNEDDKSTSLFHKENLKQEFEENISTERGRRVAINTLKVHLPMLKRCEEKKLVWSSKIDVEIALVKKWAEKGKDPNSFPRIHRLVDAPIEQKRCEVVWSVLVNERNEWSSAHIEEMHCE